MISVSNLFHTFILYRLLLYCVCVCVCVCVYIKEMKVGVLDLGAKLNVRGVEQPVVASLYVDDTVPLAESEGMGASEDCR